LTQFGAFVELEEGIDGLVHISDLSWTKKIRHPSEVVKKGDEIEVVVLGINRDERRIALGHKQIDENPWDAFENKYKVDTETEGTVSRIIDKGVIVTLPLGVDGFIPINHLGHPKLKKATEYYKTGDQVPAVVIEFDKDNKKIVLSVSNYFKEKEEKEWEEYLSKQGVEKNTMEEILKSSFTTVEKKPAEKETKTESVGKEESSAEVKVEETTKEKAEDKVVEEKAAEVVVVDEKPDSEPVVGEESKVAETKEELPAPAVEDEADVKKETKKKTSAAAEEKTKIAEEPVVEEKKSKVKITKKKAESTTEEKDTKKKEEKTKS
jgi:small subunit ribosomal protein S1